MAPCKQTGVHLTQCSDSECRGCYPRAAERGFLCAAHFDCVEHALIRWSDFAIRAGRLGLSKAVQRDNAGVPTTADGHVNLTGDYLALDECRRFLRTSADSAEMWVQTEAGAADAIQFAAAAERAYRSHEVEERPHRIRRVRCPECQQQMIWHPPAWYEGHVTVRCTNDECRCVLSQDEYEDSEKTA